MDKKLKIIITIALLILTCNSIYIVFSGIFMGEKQLLYWAVLPISSEDSYNNSFGVQTNFDVLGGWVNIDSTKSVTSNYLLRKIYSDSAKAYMIMGYMDFLSCFAPGTITIEKQNIKRKKYSYVRAIMIKNEIYVNIILPYASFLTTKLVPDGDHMIIKGLDTVSTKIIKHKYITEYRYIGSFDQIGFTLNNTSWFKRNTSRRYVFYGQNEKQYGSLSIFIDKNNVRSFMIYYVKDAGKEGYDKYFPEIAKALETIETYGSYGEYKKNYGWEHNSTSILP